MALAERADLIVDFTNVPPGSHVLANIGPDKPFGGGEPDVGLRPVRPGHDRPDHGVPGGSPDGQRPDDAGSVPAASDDHAPSGSDMTRPLALVEEMSAFFADARRPRCSAPVEGDPASDLAPTMPMMWSEPVTENPTVGEIETWEFYNATSDAHPMHIHEVLFEVINRQPIHVEEESHEVQLEPGSEPRPPEPWEAGWKDTVTAYPGEVTRVKMKFESRASSSGIATSCRTRTTR